MCEEKCVNNSYLAFFGTILLLSLSSFAGSYMGEVKLKRCLKMLFLSFFLSFFVGSHIYEVEPKCCRKSSTFLVMKLKEFLVVHSLLLSIEVDVCLVPVTFLVLKAERVRAVHSSLILLPRKSLELFTLFFHTTKMCASDYQYSLF